MARTTKKSAKVRAKAKAVEPVEDEDEDDVVEDDDVEEAADDRVTGMDRIAQRKDTQPNWEAYSDFVVEHGGPRIKPNHIGIVLTGYHHYQKSDLAKEVREQVAAERAEKAAEREAAQQQRAKDRAAREEEKAERAAAREAKATKKTATKKTAAAASKPAGKKAAAKKTTGKRGGARKAAF